MAPVALSSHRSHGGHGGRALLGAPHGLQSADSACSSSPGGGVSHGEAWGFFHGNEYAALATAQSTDRSTFHREARFSALAASPGGLLPAVPALALPRAAGGSSAGAGEAAAGGSTELLGSPGMPPWTLHRWGDHPLTMPAAAAANTTATTTTTAATAAPGCFYAPSIGAAGAAGFLSDAANQRWPVFRTGAKPDTCVTVMAWVADLAHGTLGLWAGGKPPAGQQPPILAFDLRRAPAPPPAHA